MKDINFKDPNCTHTLVSGLAHYSANYGYEQSKKWALHWIEKNLPGEFDRLKNAKESQFSNRGYICRMVEHGLVISEELKEKLITFFKNIDTQPKIEDASDPVARPKKTQERINSIIFQLEDAVDAILSDEEPNAITVPVDAKQIKEAKEWIEKEVIEAVEQINKYTAILSQLESTYERCGGIAEKLKKPSAAKAPVKKNPVKSDHVEKAKIIKEMPVLKEVPELGVAGLSPIKIPESSQVMIYNTKYRSVNMYYAAPGQKLSVNRSSIKGYDEDKSFSQTVRKPEEFLKSSNREKLLPQLTTKKNPVNPRVSKVSIILEVK